MGCATSKEPPVCRNCKGSRAPITRSYSMHVHHPPQTDGDSYHVVALKSTTLGYLQLDPSISNEIHQDSVELYKENPQFSVGVIDAKTWSKMIDEKIPKIVPKTPVRTPPGEPETINAWELMEGLDDTSPLRPKSDAKSNHIRSFSFHVNPNTLKSLDFPPPAIFSDELPAPEKFSDDSPAPATVTDGCGGGGDTLGVMNSEKLLQPGYCGDGKNVSVPRVQEKLVLYFTSLRGVRKTYEDCCHVRHILKGTGVRVDERDVSMHSGFKEELKELLGGVIGGGLPKVFIGSKCIGGAAEIRRLHEDGNLEKAVEGCEMVDGGGCGGGGGGGGGGCEACGDIRFLPCETCSGSCKIYYENEDECDEDDDGDNDDDEEKEDSDYGFQRCPDCNENGLIRCPICCD